MQNKNNMEKPITMVIDEFKKEIVTSINKSQLPLFVLDYIMKDIYNEIHISNLNSAENDRIKYEREISTPNDKKAEND